MTDPAGGPGIWYVVGTGAAMALSGAVSWFASKHKRAVGESESRLEVSANGAVERALLRLDNEVRELNLEIAEFRKREDEARERERRLRRYIHTLINAMQTAGVTPPEYADTGDEQSRD